MNGFISKNEIWLDYNPCFIALINYVLLHAGYVATRTNPWADNLFYLTVELLFFKKEKRLRLRPVAIQSSLYKNYFFAVFTCADFFEFYHYIIFNDYFSICV